MLVDGLCQEHHYELTAHAGKPINTTAGVRVVAELEDELVVVFCAAAPPAAIKAAIPSQMRENNIFQCCCILILVCPGDWRSCDKIPQVVRS